LLPVATGAVAAGRIGTVVAFVLLPLIGVLVGRVLTGNPRTASRAAWGAGLLTAVTAAFVPLAWPVVVIAAVAATAAWSWLGPRTVLNGRILALVVSRATVRPPQGGAAVSAWPGLAIAIAAAGLLLAATPLIEVIGRALTGQAGAGRADPDGSGHAGPGWRFAASVAGLA